MRKERHQNLFLPILIQKRKIGGNSFKPAYNIGGNCTTNFKK
jgi:hypothetical protein